MKRLLVLETVDLNQIGVNMWISKKKFEELIDAISQIEIDLLKLKISKEIRDPWVTNSLIELCRRIEKLENENNIPDTSLSPQSEQ